MTRPENFFLFITRRQYEIYTNFLLHLPQKVLSVYVYFKKNFFLKYHSAQPLLYSTDPHAGSGASVIIKIE